MILDSHDLLGMVFFVSSSIAVHHYLWKEEALKMICDDIIFEMLVVSSLDEETMKILTSK